MDVQVKINFDDFYEAFNSEGIVGDIRESVLEDITRVLKKDARYKAFLQDQASVALQNLLDGGEQ